MPKLTIDQALPRVAYDIWKQILLPWSISGPAFIKRDHQAILHDTNFAWEWSGWSSLKMWGLIKNYTVYITKY